MTVPTPVVELVERFRRNLDVYKRDDYKEARVRVEFIDPLFEALGWDVRNEQGYAEQYKDVVQKPSVQVKGDVGPAYQLRRYAWSAKLPLSILTDFEEFAVYDCRQRPKPNDKASVGRVIYLTFEEYPDRWDEIYGILAKESVLKGSFDRYVQDTRRKRGTSEVDAEFLKEIEGWRETLARNIARRNPALSVYELNFAVQRTIDRIIFLRMSEDRGIESYGRLQALTSGANAYARLRDLYRQADEKYNAGLFDFRADTLTPALSIDDKVLKPILADLYYPQCPYEFSVLPADVLGQVYEQFLGKVIRLTPAHRAKVEAKPEVKKAGGVYYTPTYIVDYIVKQTVGRLVEGKTPRQIGKLRILDPACGSGSFLLGAYQWLLDYHRQWYESHDPAKQARRQQPAVYQGPRGEWRLTTAEKKRILLNNIYGVDIDRQAVEVTKLSLLLKVLEGESQETLGQQLRLWQERALPDLGDNIKCGNSLIGPDYFEAQLLPDEDEVRRVNPFDWQREFPEAMAAGGFNAVIGNPPYISFYSRESIKPLRAVEKYLTRRFSDEIGGRKNTFLMFLVQSARLMSPNGYVAMIVPDTLTINDSYEATRRYLTSSNLSSVARLDFPVFFGPTVRTTIPILGPSADTVRFIVYDSKSSLESKGVVSEVDVPRSAVLERRACRWLFSDLSVQNLLSKIEYCSTPLESIAETRDGINPGPKSFRTTILNPDGPSKPTWRPVIEGRHVERFGMLPTTEVVDYDPNLLTRDLKKRGSSFRDPCIFTAPKLVNRQTADTLIFAFDDIGYCTLNSVHNTRARDGKRSTLLYLLGLLNSKTLRFYYRKNSEETRDVFPQVHISALRQLPIRPISFDDPADVARHERMVGLVERMLALHKKLAAAQTPDDKALYQRQIDATDRQIDALVYELYKLTEAEIAIVEGATDVSSTREMPGT